jgi:hypothetical protein
MHDKALQNAWRKTPTAEKVVAALNRDEFRDYLESLPDDVRFIQSSTADCPIARYLQDRTGAPIRVHTLIALWYEGGEDVDYNQCILPAEFQRFAREFDRGPRDVTTPRGAREVWARVTAPAAE